MRIEIDRDTCVGSGMCVMTAPETFVDDDEGFSTLLPGGADHAGDPAVREAVDSCPVRAIRISDA
jgi:ferredoxin